MSFAQTQLEKVENLSKDLAFSVNGTKNVDKLIGDQKSFYTHTHTHTHTYIYIYIYNWRTKNVDKKIFKSLLRKIRLKENAPTITNGDI